MIDLFSKVPLHLDKNAAQDVRALNADAWESPSIRRSAQRIVDVLRELTNEIAAVSFVSEPTKAAMQSNCGNVDGVLARLRMLEQRMDDALVDVLERKSGYAAELEARRKEMAPTILRVSREALDSEERIKSIRKHISGFDRAREQCRERFEAAGLTASQVDSVGLKPTKSDLAAWHTELESLGARKAQINAFLKSSPTYDTSLLGERKASV